MICDHTSQCYVCHPQWGCRCNCAATAALTEVFKVELDAGAVDNSVKRSEGTDMTAVDDNGASQVVKQANGMICDHTSQCYVCHPQWGCRCNCAATAALTEAFKVELDAGAVDNSDVPGIVNSEELNQEHR